MDENKKKRKSKFSFLRALGLTGGSSKEPTINNAANKLSSRKKMLDENAKKYGFTK